MNKTLSVMRNKLRSIREQGGEVDPNLPPQEQPDIAQPVPDAAPQQTQALTSKGEEFLVKMAYLALLYTPKDDEVMNIKNTFESSGINSENDIRGEDPNSIKTVKDIINSIISTNTATVADDLNQLG